MHIPGFTAERSVENAGATRFIGGLPSASFVDRAVVPALRPSGNIYRRLYCTAVCAACGDRDAGEWCWRCSRCQMTGDA